MDHLRQKQSKNPGGDVVQHDAGTFEETLELADWRRFEDVEETEEKQAQCCVAPVGGDGDEGNELAGNLVDDNVAGVLAARLAGHDGRRRDAD